MFEKMMKKIADGEYKTKQDGIKDIKTTYDRGMLTITEKNDLLASLNWYFTTNKNNNGYIVLY